MASDLMEALMAGPQQNLTVRNSTSLNERENQFIEAIVNRLLVARVPVEIAKAAVIKPLLDNREAAQVIGITPGTLHVWRCTGRHQIKFIRVGSKIRYRLEDLLAWLESRAVVPKPEQKPKRKRSGPRNRPGRTKT